MNKFHYLIPLFLVLASASCHSETDAANNNPANVDYDFWVTLEEAQINALDEGKYILLDVYTEWCGFCRRMNRETYGDERVQIALEQYFYPVRIDAESTTEVMFQGETYSMIELAYAFGVGSYPTTIFISPDGEPVASQPGFVEAARFHKMLSFIGSESFQTQTFQQYTEIK